MAVGDPSAGALSQMNKITGTYSLTPNLNGYFVIASRWELPLFLKLVENVRKYYKSYFLQDIMEEQVVSSATGFDPASIREEEFELHTTYIVPDLPVEPGTPNRAEATLPRNLVLKSSQALSDVSIQQFFLHYKVY